MAFSGFGSGGFGSNNQTNNSSPFGGGGFGSNTNSGMSCNASRTKLSWFIGLEACNMGFPI